VVEGKEAKSPSAKTPTKSESTHAGKKNITPIPLKIDDVDKVNGLDVISSSTPGMLKLEFNTRIFEFLFNKALFRKSKQ
jgi:hypothetical protein